MTVKTPLVQYVWNRYGKATSKKEAVVELRITYERRQKYISTNIWLLWLQFEKIWKLDRYLRTYQSFQILPN